MTQQQETLIRPPNTPGAQEAEGGIQQLTPTPENNTQGLGEQMKTGNEVTQRCRKIHFSPSPKCQFSERHEKQYHTHGLQRCTCCQTSRQGCRGYG